MRLSLPHRAVPFLLWRRPFLIAHRLRLYSSKTSDPLKILYCGSDDFSCVSLRALNKERLENPGLIRSIDVLTRPGKKVGRGLQTVQHPPVSMLAQELGLGVHTVDAFTDWELPLTTDSEHFNLIIAVSFGLFIPQRILRAVQYGGLNVHPSLLPDLRGSAPIQWTIINHRRWTGVTLQTLDEREFDKGVILSQTPRPGIRVPFRADYDYLSRLLANVGAEMLIDGLRGGVHVPPLEPATATTVASNNDDRPPPLQKAPKVGKQDAQVMWGELWRSIPPPGGHGPRRLGLGAGAPPAPAPSGGAGWRTAEDMERRNLALGPLWSYAITTTGGGAGSSSSTTTTTTGQLEPHRVRRVLFDGLSVVTADMMTGWTRKRVYFALLNAARSLVEGGGVDRGAPLQAERERVGDGPACTVMWLQGAGTAPDVKEAHAEPAPAPAASAPAVPAAAIAAAQTSDGSEGRDRPVQDRFRATFIQDEDGKAALLLLDSLIPLHPHRLEAFGALKPPRSEQTLVEKTGCAPQEAAACVRIKHMKMEGKQKMNAWDVVSLLSR